VHAFKKLRSAHHYLSHYAQFPALFREIVPNPQNGNPTRGKSGFAAFIDRLYLFFVLGVVPRNYYLFGFNEKEREEFKDYMDEPVAPLLKARLYEALWNDSYSSLVNDKYVFHCLCRCHGIPVPDVYGIWAQGSIKGDGSSLEQVMEREGQDRVILKPLRGLQGKGIYFVHREGTGVRVEPVIPSGGAVPKGPEGEFIVQEVIHQHPELDRINPYCLNSVRIITLLTRDNDVKFLASMLRTSSKKIPIDNFSLGGIVIKIDMETGRLKVPGFMIGRTIKRVSEHPITGVPLEGFAVPYWNEVKETVAKAQKVFSELKAIGWDLAVTPDGPVMIEGNIEWGTTGIQATNGGLLTAENRALFSQYGLTFHQ
jgi:hypothetical protein